MKNYLFIILFSVFTGNIVNANQTRSSKNYCLPPINSYTLSLTADKYSVCAGDSIILSAYAQGAGTTNGYNFYWSSGAGTDSILPNSSLNQTSVNRRKIKVPMAPGIYTYTVETTFDNMGSLNKTINIEVIGGPKLDVTYRNDSAFFHVNFVLLESNCTYMIQWLKDGYAISGGINVYFSTDIPGTYSVRVLTVNQSGNACSCGSVSDSCVFYIATGVQDINNLSKFKVTYDVNANRLNINGKAASYGDVSIRLINVLGQVVFQSKIDQESASVDLNTVNIQDICFVQIYDNKKNISETRKIVIH